MLDEDKPTVYQGSGKKYANLRNVAGELEAATQAVNIAIQKKYAGIVIYYDYAGIYDLSVKKKKFKNKREQAYASFIQSSKRKIQIQFKKVKAHSAVEWNEAADKAAKQACGLLKGD